MYKFKKDNFKDNRGTWSRVLELTCHFCNHHLSYYQKDGPGPLKRSYVDRFIDFKKTSTNKSLFKCPNCKEVLGVYNPYKKEKGRPAYSWLVGVLDYKIVPISKLEEVPDKVH